MVDWLRSNPSWVHTLSAFSGVLLITLGLVWPRLQLGVRCSRIAFWFLVYSDLATVAAFLLAAVWGAGNNHAVGGRSRTRQRISGGRDQVGGVLSGANSYHIVRADLLGPAQRAGRDKFCASVK